jgi:hypothetical protein
MSAKTVAHPDPAAAAGEAAPLDERPESGEERAMIAEARADAAAGAAWIPGEHVTAAIKTGSLDALRALLLK